METQQINAAIDTCSRERNGNSTLQRHWRSFVGVYDHHRRHGTAGCSYAWECLKSVTRGVELASIQAMVQELAVLCSQEGETAEEGATAEEAEEINASIEICCMVKNGDKTFEVCWNAFCSFYNHYKQPGIAGRHILAWRCLKWFTSKVQQACSSDELTPSDILAIVQQFQELRCGR
ncbi:hypothetical protein ACCS93_38855 [Rhizobium ruizarguesonis]